MTFAGNKISELSCKLTSAEFKHREGTVINSLKAQIIEKIELTDGFAYKFLGTDNVVDELAEFVKTERTCCDFFNFNLSISGDKSEAWLEIKGPAGAKDFIIKELDM